MSSHSRADLIRRARRLRDEIEQIFADQEHWNAAHPASEQINVDEDGKLRRIVTALNATLAKEASCQHQWVFAVGLAELAEMRCTRCGERQPYGPAAAQATTGSHE